MGEQKIELQIKAILEDTHSTPVLILFASPKICVSGVPRSEH